MALVFSMQAFPDGPTAARQLEALYKSVGVNTLDPISVKMVRDVQMVYQQKDPSKFPALYEKLKEYIRQLPKDPPMMRVMATQWALEATNTPQSLVGTASVRLPVGDTVVTATGPNLLQQVTQAVAAGVINPQGQVVVPQLPPAPAPAPTPRAHEPPADYDFSQVPNADAGRLTYAPVVYVPPLQQVVNTSPLPVPVANVVVTSQPVGAPPPVQTQMPPPPPPQPAQTMLPPLAPDTSPLSPAGTPYTAMSVSDYRTIYDGVADVGQQTVRVVAQAVAPPPEDEPVFLGLTKKQLAVGAGGGLALFLLLRRRR